MKRFLTILLVFLLFTTYAETAKERESRIKKDLTEVDYPCTFDNSKQKAYTYIAKGKDARPLVVALHTFMLRKKLLN